MTQLTLTTYLIQQLKTELDKTRNKLLMKKYKPTEAETKKAFCDFIEKTLEMIGLKDKITEIRLDKYIKILGKKCFPMYLIEVWL